MMDVDDDDDDVTAKAYASIAAQLERFTSPMIGSLQTPRPTESSSENPYEMDAMEWMKHELSSGDGDQQHHHQHHHRTHQATTMSTPKRTPLLERADTPVMSNSSSKKKKKSSTNDDDDDDEVMEPVRTPFKANARTRAVSSPRALTTLVTTTATTASTRSSSTSSRVYRRYHDALWNYLKAKRSISHRMDLEQQDQELTFPTTNTNNNEQQQQQHSSSSLANQECRAEVEYLRSLHTIAWQSSSSGQQVEEGNLWSLLVVLRKLGLSALIWNDDTISAGQNFSAQTVFLQQLSAKIHATPKELLEELNTTADSTSSTTTTTSPLVLQRRYQLLQWMQSCMDHQARSSSSSSSLSLSSSSSIPKRTTTTHPDDTPPLVQEAQRNLLQVCLSHILAGRLEDTKALARSNGQFWRAAAWCGGEPAGYTHLPNETTQTVDKIPTGNPNRFLWKRQVWANGRRLLQHNHNNSYNQDEAAIYSLLANDIQTCMSNPALRTWQQSLYVLWFSICGRIEDELLHWHNNHRRNIKDNTHRPPFPGTEFEKQETEQLLATAGLSGMTESQVIRLLLSSPFHAIRGTGCYESAMAAFLIGKSAILEYCDLETSQSEHYDHNDNDDNDDEENLVRLRFLTHLTLYLDSLHASTTPIVLDGLTEQKNRILFQYVRYLESRSDLWHLLALYVSLLPEEHLLDYYPTVLVNVLEDSERQAMLEQMRELFPNLEIHVLRQVVRLSLAVSSSSSSSDNNTTTNVIMDDDDDTKCQSIQWLLHHDEHYGDALICSNILLRDFFLNEQDDKMETAMIFVEEHLPDELLERAGQLKPTFDTLDPTLYTTKVDNARSEHLAFLSYLDAYRTFGKWKDVLSETPPTSGTSTSSTTTTDGVDLTRLTSTETKIAQHRMVKDWIRQKKQKCQTVLDAAEQARTVLTNVLTHPGGWLSTDDEQEQEQYNTLYGTGDDENTTRLQEIAEIRARYLVLAVNLYHQVCEDTASWMSRSLDDASLVHLTRDEALQHLEKDNDHPQPLFAPAFWYQQALDLAILVASDAHGIHKSFGSLELQEFMAKLAETAVSKLMNA